MRTPDSQPYLESIPIQIRPGSVERAVDTLTYRTRDGQGRATLPSRAEAYLQAFSRVTDLETLILDHLARGQVVDYRLLKTTVLALYHGNCISNSGDLRPYIEAWQQPPLREPSLLTAFARARPSRQADGYPVFTAAAATLALWIFLLLPSAQQALSGTPRFVLFILLTPGALLSLQSLLFWLLDQLAGHGDARFGGRVSPLGPHLETDARPFQSRPVGALALATAMSFLLPFFAAKAGANIAIGRVGGPAALDFLENLTLILVSLTLFPGLRGPLSLARAELMKRGRMRGAGADATMNGAFVAAAIIGLCACFGFIAEATIEALRLALPPFPVFRLGGVLAALLALIQLAWAILLISDLLSAVESLADDLELFEPVRDRAEAVWARLRHGRQRGDLRRIQIALDKHPLFQSLPAELREPLSGAARLMTSLAGDRIVRQGSRTTELYLLISGQVGVYRRDPETRGTELLLRLGPGSVFGEAGFFLDQERTADIVALERAVLVQIQRPAAFRPNESAASHDVFRKKIWASQVLSDHSLFRSLPSEAILHVLNFSEAVTVPPRHPIMREGEPSDSLWLLVQGAAAVNVSGAPRPDAVQGDVLGEIGLIWNSPRTATVQAREECVFLRLGAASFRTLVSRNLNFGAQLQDLGAKRLERDRGRRL